MHGLTCLLTATSIALAATSIMSSGGPSAREDAAVAAFRTPTGEPDRDAVVGAYEELPLAFVENRGQTDSRALYYVQRSGSAFFITRAAIVLSLASDSRAVAPAAGGAAAAARGPVLPVRGLESSAALNPPDNIALALRFVGSNPGMTVIGEARLPGHVNYLRGNDPAAWHTNVPRYARVVYREIWPGIDLVLRASAAQLKYEFRVRPGARPSDIRLAYAGATGLEIDDAGALQISTAVGVVRDSAPVSWQEIDGARVAVDSRYVLADPRAALGYGFVIGAYDPDHELVIDPGLDYSTFLGGSSNERAAGVALDPGGDAYVVGTTQSTDFPATTGAVDRGFNGGTTDVFVARLNATGSALVYATYLGGTPTPLRRGTGDNVEFGRAIAVDADGFAYITGLTDSSDFPVTSGAFQPSLNATPDDARDAFVVKLNPSGSGLVYGTFLGGTALDDGWSIAIDQARNAYVAGDTGSTDFPVTGGAAQPARGGGRDAFVAQLDAAGSALVYATYLGGADNEVGNAITVDAAGHAYVAGGTRSADFPTTAAAFRPVHHGGTFENLFDAFLAKLTTSGGLVYSTLLGGTRIDIASDVAVDATGSAYVVGSTSSPEFPTTEGAFDRTTSGGFVTKFTADGSSLVYSTFLGGGGSSAVALDADNRAWIAGTANAGAPTTPDAFAQNSGGTDAWLARLSADGSALEFATFIGGGNGENGVGVALDAGGNVYLAGTTFSFDFPTTAGAFDTTFGGDPTIFWGDAFVAKFGTGTGTVNPPATTTTTEFSGRLDRNQARFHTVTVGSPGDVDLTLNWTESRANLTLRVRDGSNTQVFFDGSSARPKEGSFTAANAGNHQIEVTNTSDRRTNYTLAVTHPVASTTIAQVALLTLDPSSVTGGTSSIGSVSLTAAAPAGGASVALSSSNAAAATVPASVIVPAGLTTATFTVSTSSVSANTTATISASYNGSTRSATLTVNAPGGPTLSTLTLSPTTVAGGSPSTGTVTLSAAAPAGGASVALSSSNTATATVPAAVTVAAGATSATFTVSTSAVSFNSSSAISASHGGVTRTVILSVTASGGSTAALSSVSVNPATITGGNSSTGTVTLTSAAPSGSFTVALSSEAPASVPASVTVAQGSTSATFPVATTTVESSSLVTISASAGGVIRTAVLTVNPPAQMATLTVTATGRSGERVISNPAGLSVSVGTTQSASFPIGTVITLSVSNGRDAIWSGACSTADKERSCSFTLNGNASVTANVQ